MASKSCCCCIPLRVGVLLLSILTLLSGSYGIYAVTSAAIRDGNVPLSFDYQGFNWWFYALVSLVLVLTSLAGLVGLIAKKADAVFAYYYGFEAIVFMHLGLWIISGVFIMFNLNSYCNAINNSDWSHAIQSFGQAKDQENYEDFTISQCRNIAIVSFILEAVAILLGFYFASRIYACGQRLLDRHIQTTRAVHVARVERDLQAKV